MVLRFCRIDPLCLRSKPLKNTSEEFDFSKDLPFSQQIYQKLNSFIGIFKDLTRVAELVFCSTPLSVVLSVLYNPGVGTNVM